MAVSLKVVVDYDEIAKRVWERLIPVTPVSGAFEEKVKEVIIRRELLRSTGSATIAAGAWSDVNIAIPAGETWEVAFGGVLWGLTSGKVEIFLVDEVSGISSMFHRDIDNNPPSFSPAFGDENVTLKVRGVNSDTADRTLYYGYFGFKVKSSSIKLAELTPTRRWHEEIGLAKQRLKNNPSILPDYLEPLRDKAKRDEISGEIVIVLEEDVPLKVDEKGNVIESISSYVPIKTFEILWGDIIADTTKRPIMSYIRSWAVRQKSKWVDIIDKWKEEGIEF